VVVATIAGPEGIEEFDRVAIGGHGPAGALAILRSRIEAFGFTFADQGPHQFSQVYARWYFPEDLLGIRRDERLIQTLDAYLAQHPHDSHALASRAFAFQFQNDEVRAEEYARRAVNANQNHYLALVALASSLNELGRPSEAVPYVQRAIAFEQRNGILKGSGRIILGQIHEQLGLPGPVGPSMPPFEFFVQCVTYWDGSPHHFFDSTCTLNEDSLVVRDRRGNVQQTRLNDVASVGARVGLFAGKTVEIKIGTRALLEVTCSSIAQRDEIIQRVGSALSARYR
jgi:tetratricopeptide (TPR) repeat protein